MLFENKQYTTKYDERTNSVSSGPYSKRIPDVTISAAMLATLYFQLANHVLQERLNTTSNKIQMTVI